MGEYTVADAGDGTLAVATLDTYLPYAPTDLDLDPDGATRVLVMADSLASAVVILDADGTETEVTGCAVRFVTTSLCGAGSALGAVALVLLAQSRSSSSSSRRRR